MNLFVWDFFNFGKLLKYFLKTFIVNFFSCFINLSAVGKIG